MLQLVYFQEFRFEKSSRFLKSVFRSCKALFNQNETSQDFVILFEQTKIQIQEIQKFPESMTPQYFLDFAWF